MVGWVVPSASAAAVIEPNLAVATKAIKDFMEAGPGFDEGCIANMPNIEW
jgi:hypothetical protein